MVKILMVRHGQSLSNIDNLFAGSLDKDLSELGMQQAEKTAEYIAENYHIDKIYSSDLKRAYQTAVKISEKTGAEVIKDENLREIYGGEWEGKNYDDLSCLYRVDYGEKWRHDIGNATCTGGESVKHLYERISSEIKKIASENDGKTIVIASHATPVRVAECFFRGLPVTELKNIRWVSNASVTVLEYENGDVRFIERSHDAHLAGIKTELPDTV